MREGESIAERHHESAKNINLGMMMLREQNVEDNFFDVLDASDALSLNKCCCSISSVASECD